MQTEMTIQFHNSGKAKTKQMQIIGENAAVTEN